MTETEQDIQKLCLNYLRDNGFLCWKQPSQGLRVNGGRRAKCMGGSTVGHPDLMAIKDGNFYCIEVKKPGGKVHRSQVAWLTFAQMNGAKCMVVRSLQEMIDKLKRSESYNDFIDTFE